MEILDQWLLSLTASSPGYRECLDFLEGEPGAVLMVEFFADDARQMEARLQSFQKAMPRGAFNWVIHRTTQLDGHSPYARYEVAVAGEDAMKPFLAKHLVAPDQHMTFADKRDAKLFLFAKDEPWAASRRAWCEVAYIDILRRRGCIGECAQS